MATRFMWAENASIQITNFAQDAYNGASSYNYSDAEKRRLDSTPEDTSATNVLGTGDNFDGAYVIQFDNTYNISQIGIRKSDSVTIWYSTDTTDGLDGTWSYVVGTDFTDGQRGASSSYLIHDITEVTTKFIKFMCQGNSEFDALHFFGDNNGINFELRTSDDAGLLTANYLAFDNIAYDNADFTDTKQFRIKNTDSVAHTYSVTIAAVDSSGDSIITTAGNFQVEADSDGAQETTTTTGSIAAGSYSLISIHADIASADNNADGKHYFSLEVSEAS